MPRNTSHTCRKKHLNGLLWRRCAPTQSVNTLPPDFLLYCLWTIRLLLTNQIACGAWAEYGSMILLSKAIPNNVRVSQRSDRNFGQCRLDWNGCSGLLWERFWYPEMWKLWAGEQIIITIMCYSLGARCSWPISDHSILSWARLIQSIFSHFISLVLWNVKVILHYYKNSIPTSPKTC